MPDAPEIDGVTAEILEAYAYISRSRQYVGMVGAPAPITPSAITEYLDRYPSAICREEFDAAVFALDDQFRKHWEEQNEEARADAESKSKPKRR
ncbi:hypothetical protein ACNFCI_09800 [Pseudomonas sp. NY15356]|uniref:hypothetical protein n=1 Tax=Pseudomonas sp. NY15356 TaxID=3400352 RepID=UPI003A851DC4